MGICSCIDEGDSGGFGGLLVNRVQRFQNRVWIFHKGVDDEV